MKRLSLAFAVLACVVASQPLRAGALLGPAAGYNGFFFDDFTLTNSSAGGAIAAGGDAKLTGFSVGSVLIVGGNLTATNGSLGGDAVHGGTVSLSGVGLHGTVSQGNPIDFAAAQTFYKGYSTFLSQLGANGSVAFRYGRLTLTGTSTTLNVFNVLGSQLGVANSVVINVPQGSTVLVNVDGEIDSMSNFGFQEGTSVQNVLFNFYQATTITASGIGIAGSVLSPWADFVFGNGNLDGTLIAKTYSGGAWSVGALNNVPFGGNLPWPVINGQNPDPVPEPNSLAVLGVALLGLALAQRARRGERRTSRVI